MTDGPKGTRTGGQILVDALRLQGVDTVFCVPGESFLAALDALYEARSAIRLISCRHEGGAGFMAEAYGKLTGRVGVCFVSRGPGACNVSIAVHTARQDSTPLLLIVGQIDRATRDREAFQEIDVRMFGGLAKCALEVSDPRRLPEYVSRAFHVALSGRPGPVVLSVPEDVLTECCAVQDVGPHHVVRPAPSAGRMEQFAALLGAARRPFLLLGGGGWSEAAVADMRAFLDSHGLPVGTAFRCQDLFDNDHPCYAGDVGIGINPALARRVAASDLLIAVGTRLDEATTQNYTLPSPPKAAQTLVHVFADPDELGRVYRPDLPIASGMAEFAALLRELAPPSVVPWRDWTQAARADYEAWQKPDPVPGPLDMAVVVRLLAERIGQDGLIVTDGGNFSGWSHRFYRYRRYRSQLGPTCGAMGYGVPAAIAAKLVQADRPVVCFVGDGGFGMTGQEIATALQYGSAPVILVVNNNMYGTIRMHQEREYPGRVIATDLKNPDFGALARAFGAHGEVVEKTSEFAGALDRALAAKRVSVIELRIDPEAITTRTTLSKLREQALGKRLAGPQTGRL
jgi:acetolactate synthase-1/2/3 large subunit